MNNVKKTIIVTGASSGIGLAVAEAYLKRGHNVVGNARGAEKLEAARAKLGNPQNFLTVAGDISVPGTSKTLFERAIAAFGKVDVLINNAGVFIPKQITDYTEADVSAMLATNLNGFFYPSQQAAAHMAQNKDGHIVTITASLAMQPSGKIPALLPILVKGGLNAATRGLAIELAASNVRVNAVAPGIIDTPMHGKDEATQAFLRSMSPSGRTGATDDIVNAVLYLTDSGYVSGTVMVVDGGSTAGAW